MATITSFQTDPATVVTPTLVLEYGYEYGSGNVVHDAIYATMPNVTLRPLQSRGGTLRTLHVGRAAATAMEELLQIVGTFRFEAPETGEDFYFVVTGPVQLREVTGTTNWTVAVQFREVAP